MADTDLAAASPSKLGATEWEAIIVGGGLAGLSAAIYLGRALRKVLVIDNGNSLAIWEPHVQNYLGFPDGVRGDELLNRGRVQAQHYGADFVTDTVESAQRETSHFELVGRTGGRYQCQRLLLATGLYHLPPDIPGVPECLGQSMFFCKDCDAHRVQGHRIAIIGRNDEAVEYALAMLLYSSCVVIATNGKPRVWDEEHARWLTEYNIPVLSDRIQEVAHKAGKVLSLTFADHGRFGVDSIFTTRGDVYHNTLAQGLGARIDAEGQITVDEKMRTSISGLYAAGCVTPSNCQMIIAAGDGASAGQAINRDLFEESLRNKSLRQFRTNQLQTEQTLPDVLP